jgi:hypothetical protein
MVCQEVRRAYEEIETSYGPIERVHRNQASWLMDTAEDIQEQEKGKYPRLLFKDRPMTRREPLVNGVRSLSRASKRSSREKKMEDSFLPSRSNNHSRMPSPVERVRTSSSSTKLRRNVNMDEKICPFCSIGIQEEGERAAIYPFSCTSSKISDTCRISDSNRPSSSLEDEGIIACLITCVLLLVLRQELG